MQSQIDQRCQILAWLSLLEPRLQHYDIRDRRAENVGEQLLQSEEFRSWCAGSGDGESNSATFFCYADPEVEQTLLGKKDEAQGVERSGQVLTSGDVSPLVIDNLCYYASGENVAIACFYFDFAAQKNSP